jgi:hypothetical protein
MLFYTSKLDVIRVSIGVPNVALTNIMAGRVFRNTILGPWREREIPIGTSIVFQEHQETTNDYSHPSETTGGSSNLLSIGSTVPFRSIRQPP